MNIWTVRHPPTDSQGICVGQSPVALQVSLHQAVQQVIQSAPIKPDVLYSSDLPRCENLAVMLAQHWNIPHHVDVRLREISMGKWEGMSYDELAHDTAWHHWCQNWMQACPPHGESLSDITQRIESWCAMIHHTMHDQKILLISHYFSFVI